MFSHRIELIGCLLLGIVVALLKGATAESYTVGEDLGWNIPPAGSVAYSTWAASKRFQLGDVVVFKWTGPHTVAEVTQVDFSSCTKSNPIALYDSSPVRITLSSLNGTRYFICTEDNHCSVLGQKVAITMGSAGKYTPVDNDGDNDDDWWRWNSASSLTIGTAFSAVISTVVIFFLNYI